MKDQGVEGKDEAVDSHLPFVEGNENSQQGVEQDDHQEEDWVREEHQGGQQEVGLAEVPLLSNLEGEQLTEGQFLPLVSCTVDELNLTIVPGE